MHLSVITICYNSIRFIERTIQSVLSQDSAGVDIEYIIIDGGSTDGTKEVIEKYADRLTYWCSEPDGGIYDAMNKGAAHASGEWVCFMNSGDEFATPQAVTVMGLDSVSDGVQVVYGDMEMAYADRTALRRAYPLRTMSYRMPFCHQAAFVRLGLVRRKPFDLKYRISADYDFFYSVYHEFGAGAFSYVPVRVARCDATDSLSQNNQYALWEEFIRIRSAHKDARWYYDSMKHIIKQLLGYGRKR